MIGQDPVTENVLNRLGFIAEGVLDAGVFGAVAAPAGVGKTALLVQFALHAMLKDQPVLHVSLQDPVQKIGLWYREMFQNLAVYEKLHPVGEIWERILPRRFIMSFQVDGFSVPRLEERISDLTAQNIFHPRLMIIDGLRFQAGIETMLADLKTFASSCGLGVWFTVHTHRSGSAGMEGQAAVFGELADFFSVILRLEAVGRGVQIRFEKGDPGHVSALPLALDPTSLMILDAV